MLLLFNSGMGRTYSGGAWTPLGGLPPIAATALLWTKSDAGVWQNTVGGTPATANAQAAGAWSDQTGLGHHLVSGNAGQYFTNQVNGKPALRFNGSTNTLAALFALPSPFDIFMVLKPISYIADAVLVSGAVGDTFGVFQHGTSPALVVYNGAGLAGNNTGLAIGSWALMETGGDVVGGINAFIKINNLATTSGGGLAVADRGGIQIAGHPGPSNWANIDVAEVIVYNAVLSAPDATAVRAYITGRYGFP